MKPKSINDPYHNPFHNRFHVPVHSRLDEMQAYTQMTWLNDQISSDTSNHKKAQKAQKLKTTFLCFLCFFAAYVILRLFAA
jgi:hypothetical protein